jgi:hypothetical protein
MVKVLANGDIVPDNDPRAQSTGSGSPGPGTGGPRQQGFINHNYNDNRGGPSVSLFDTINQRLAAAGVPTWHAGPYAVEPVVSLGFLVSLLVAGFRGLLFSGVLFLVVKYSQSGAPRRPPSGNPVDGRGGIAGNGAPQRPSGGSSSWPGGGHRLGRS